jgi:hypothetical protein
MEGTQKRRPLSICRRRRMAKPHYTLRVFALVGGLASSACGGHSVGPGECGDGGETLSCGDAPAVLPTCPEIRVKGELGGPTAMPLRPLWADASGLHVVYVDRERRIARDVLSPQTGQLLASDADKPCPVSCSLRAAGWSPQGDTSIAYSHTAEGVFSEGILLQSADGTKARWQQPWTGQFFTLGLGWDGEGFTASLLDGTVVWATARFSPKGELLADGRPFGQAAVNFGQYDVETDPANGTTVFVTGYASGVVVAGRYGRDTSLTEPDPYWVIGDGIGAAAAWTPAVALHGDTALIAWSDVDRGILAREVSLPIGQAAMPWVIGTDAGNFFKQVAAGWAKDHWVVVGQDYRGLVVGELGAHSAKQWRLLGHAPAACAAANTCPSDSSDWRWTSLHLSVSASADSAWVGFVDMTVHEVENDLAIYTYRILPLREGCAFESLASP